MMALRPRAYKQLWCCILVVVLWVSQAAFAETRWQRAKRRGDMPDRMSEQWLEDQADTQDDTRQTPPAVSDNTVRRVQPHETIAIVIHGHRDLSNVYEVSEKGTIFLPLVGETDVLHATVDDVTVRIQRALREYIRDVSVHVRFQDRQEPVAEEEQDVTEY